MSFDSEKVGNMIIAFYPGAGGNRYLLKIIGKEWDNLGISYDNQVVGQQFLHRYLLESKILETNSEYILTHCMNISHIQKKFPDHNICFIVGDLKQCLQREWALCGHDRYVKKTVMNLDRLEHYIAFKDPDWPVCNTAEEINNLPTNILKEIEQDFNNIPGNVVSNTSVLKTLEQKFINKVNSAYDTIKWHKEYYSRYPVEYTSAVNVVNINTDNNIFSATMRQELSQYKNDVFDEVWNALNV